MNLLLHPIDSIVDHWKEWKTRPKDEGHQFCRAGQHMAIKLVRPGGACEKCEKELLKSLKNHE